MTKPIHINKKITFLNELIKLYELKISKTLGNCDHLNDAVLILQDLKKDLIDTKYTGMPAKFRDHQVTLFANTQVQ